MFLCLFWGYFLCFYFVCLLNCGIGRLFVGCLSDQQKTMCISEADLPWVLCVATQMEAADPTCNVTQSQYTDTWPASPDPTAPGTWQGGHWSTDVKVTGAIQIEKAGMDSWFLRHSRYLSTGPLRQSWDGEEMGGGVCVWRGEGCRRRGSGKLN